MLPAAEHTERGVHDGPRPCTAAYTTVLRLVFSEEIAKDKQQTEGTTFPTCEHYALPLLLLPWPLALLHSFPMIRSSQLHYSSCTGAAGLSQYSSPRHFFRFFRLDFFHNQLQRLTSDSIMFKLSSPRSYIFSAVTAMRFAAVVHSSSMSLGFHKA